MIFTPAPLAGAYIIEVERQEDPRGFFARTWCAREFAENGLDTTLAQESISFNEKPFTLRGMHFQKPPHEEVKVVRCTRGVVYDVIVDLRPGSATRAKWFGTELSQENRRMLYIPKGFAHGFLTLAPCCELLYRISAFYVPGASGGVRWNDPAFGIRWPALPQVISERDTAYQDYIS